jgi:hypothetical protein
VDCSVTDWGEWAECEGGPCGGGRQTRKRAIKTPVQLGGTPCPHLDDHRECNINPCPEPCWPSPWGRWSACDKTCGWGLRKRTRTLPAGSKCPTTLKLEQVDMCAPLPCCPTDCVPTKWQDWSACTKTCGKGIQYRQRTRQTPATCFGDESQCSPLFDTQPCNTKCCPVDGQATSWGDFTPCTKSCGGGTQTRKRQIQQEPSCEGKPYPKLDDTKACNTECCPKDAVYTPWSVWGSCGAECGGGHRSRTREVVSEKECGGQDDGLLVEDQVCNERPCNQDCEEGQWKAWSACSQPCSGGSKIRTRSVQNPPTPGGKPCPPLDESAACNSDVCPEPCEIGAWEKWSECSETCGWGQKQRVRKLNDHGTGK